MNVKQQFSASVVLAGVLVWLVSSASVAAIIGNILVLAFIAVVVARSMVRLGTFGGTRLAPQLVDGIVVTGGVVATVIATPIVFDGVQQWAFIAVGTSQLRSVANPLSVFASALFVAVAALVIVAIARALPRSCSSGRLTYLAYREVAVFAAAAFVSGIMEFGSWNAVMALAAVTGFLIPAAYGIRLDQKLPPTVWIFLPHSSAQLRPYKEQVCQVARTLSDSRVVNVVSLPEAAKLLYGDYFDIAFKLGETDVLFPKSPVALRNWSAFAPRSEAALAMPRRELYADADVMPEAASRLIGPTDQVIVLSQSEDSRDTQLVADIAWQLPAQRSLHIRIDENESNHGAVHTSGLIEVTMSADAFLNDGIANVLLEHHPVAMQAAVVEKPAKREIPRDLFAGFRSLLTGIASWHVVALVLMAILVGLDIFDTQPSGDIYVPYRGLIQVLSSSIILVVLYAWGRSTLPNPTVRNSTWIYEEARFLGLRIPAFRFALIVATLGIIAPIVYLNLNMFQAAPGFDADAIEEIIVAARRRGPFHEPIALVALLLIWTVVPFRDPAAYVAAAKPTPPAIGLIDVDVPKIGFWRVFFYVACGVGAAQIIVVVYQLIDASLGSLGIAIYDDLISNTLSSVEAAAIFYFGTRLLLSAVQHRWAPYAPDAARFALVCLVGYLIGSQIGNLLEAGLADITVAFWSLFVDAAYYIPSVAVWLSATGPVVAGALYLQRRRMADLRNLRSLVIPIGVAAFFDGFFISDLNYEYIDDYVVSDSIWSMRQVVLAYFFFLIIGPRAMLRNADGRDLSQISTKSRRVLFRTLIFGALPIFLILFFPFEDYISLGKWYVTDWVTLYPGQLLLAAFLCGALVLRLQRDLPRPAAATDDNAAKVPMSNESTRPPTAQDPGTSPEPLLILTGHDSDVLSAAYSPEGNLIVSGGADGTIRLWNALSGQPIAVSSGQEGNIYCVSFSPDGEQILSAGTDGIPKTWDHGLQSAVVEFRGHTDQTWSAVYSPDGRNIASASQDSTIRIWDTSNPDHVRILRTNTGPVWTVAIAPDGENLLAGSRDSIAHIWRLKTGELMSTLSGHSGQVWSVSYSPDSMRIAMGFDDGTVQVWDATNGTNPRTLQAHEEFVRDVAWSPDGRWIVSASNDGVAIIWDAEAGDQVLRLHAHNDWVWSARFSPLGNRIVTASRDQTIMVWDVSSLIGHDSEAELKLS